MSRPIKFRVWDHDREKLIPLEDIFGSNEYMHLAYSQTGLVGGKGDLSYMQFTGLTDADGKEIYEDDIVEHSWFGDKSRHRCQVYYDEDKAGWVPFSEPAWGGYEYDNISPHLITQFKVRVIGNIYENPELIESTE